MGFCYDNTGRLCCDRCGGVKDTVKVPCPFGWCPPPALCPTCKEEVKDRLIADHHRAYGCEAASKEFAARRAERLIALA